MPRAVAQLLQHAGYEFGLMREQWCCGGPAAEMGYVDLARKHADHNVADWRAVGAKRILAPDPHDYIAFTEDYPKYFGDDYEFEIVLGVEAVARGEAVFGTALAARMADWFDRPDPFQELTPRQRDVLELLARGLKNQAIADRLGLLVTGNTLIIANIHSSSPRFAGMRAQNERELVEAGGVMVRETGGGGGGGP